MTRKERTSKGLSRRTIWLVILIEVAVVIGVIYLVVAAHHQISNATGLQSRPKDIPKSISTSMADQMGLQYIQGIGARNFSLTDQDGKTVSLTSLKGRVVLLQFMDTRCTGTCPFALAETRDAESDLGPLAKNVEFVTINVDKYHDSLSDAAAFTKSHALSSLANWHFLVGPPATLKKVWYNYNVQVNDPTATSTLVESNEMYFISPQGQLRYGAINSVEYNALGKPHFSAKSEARWGRTEAAVARSLLK